MSECETKRERQGETEVQTCSTLIISDSFSVFVCLFVCLFVVTLFSSDTFQNPTLSFTEQFQCAEFELIVFE